MTLNAGSVNQQLSASQSATAKLTASCQNIINTQMPADFGSYNTLKDQLQRAQTLAQQWQTQYSTQFREAVLNRVIDCGEQFAAQRAKIDATFAQAASNLAAAQVELSQDLATLKSATQMIPSAVADYTQGLRSWGQQLLQIHSEMADTTGQIQEQQANLNVQIDNIHENIVALGSQIKTYQRAIDQAEAISSQNPIEILFGSIAGEIAEILAGIGVSSIAEARNRVTGMQKERYNYQTRIADEEQQLAQVQTQWAMLNNLAVPAGIVLNDLDLADQILGDVRISWEAFFQEIGDVIDKISNAQASDVVLLEKVWFNAACNEWDQITSTTQSLRH